MNNKKRKDNNYSTYKGDRYSWWCPAGCGKSVRWDRHSWVFKCERCGAEFKNKAELNKQMEAET